MNRTILILMISISICDIQCQDSIKYNNISLTPTSILFDFSIAYHRVLNDFMEFSLNPRFRPVYFSPGLSSSTVFSDYREWPFAYNRTMVRSGFLFHKKSLFFEPLVQFDYGFKNNKWTKTSYSPDRIETLIDRHYYSIGLIGLVGLYRREGNMSFKFYTGFGGHFRHFSINYIDQRGDYRDPNLPILRNYKAFGKSIHLGLDVGLYF